MKNKLAVKNCSTIKIEEQKIYLTIRACYLNYDIYASSFLQI
jgi:hypothetical protein